MLGCSHVNAYVIYVVVIAAAAASASSVLVHIVVVMLGGKINITFFFSRKIRYALQQLFQLCSLRYLIAFPSQV